MTSSPGAHPSDRQEPRLSVGVISAGAVGTTVAESLQRAGHHIHGIVARSEASRARAEDRLPGVPVTTVADAAQAALVVLAVPDPQLPAVVEQVATTVRAGQIVLHTAGALGCDVLQPITDTGALPLALHPAMTFLNRPEDTDNLQGCAWGVTTDSETGTAVAELLVSSLGGVPVAVPEDARTLYHAAMVHGANHVVTQVSEALSILDRVLGDPSVQNPESALLLRRILPTAVDAALASRMSALTGPTARDDAATVLRHLTALDAADVCDNTSTSGGSGLAEAYRQDAERTARAVGSLDVERAVRLVRHSGTGSGAD